MANQNLGKTVRTIAVVAGTVVVIRALSRKRKGRKQMTRKVCVSSKTGRKVKCPKKRRKKR